MQKRNGSSSRKRSTGRRPIDTLADEVVPWWKKNIVYIGKREVETWKGTLVLVFVAGLAIALIWSAKVDYYHPSSIAAANSTLSFNPSTATVASGSSFTLAPTINTGSNHVSIVALRITFDQTKLSLDTPVLFSYSASTTPFATAESNLATAVNNSNGTASFDVSVGNANPSASGTFAVATLTFHALATGSTSVSFTGLAGTSGAAADGETGSVITGTTPATVTINPADSTPPTGGLITYTNGYVTSASVALTVADGTDAGSGINTASRTVQRKVATLSGGSCGTYGSWTTIAPGGTYPNFTDSTVATGNCYQYQYQVSDNSGNPATYTTTNVAKIDTGAPSGGSMSYTDGYYATASVALTVADGTDAVSGVNTGSRIVKRRTSTLSAGSCGSYGVWTTITQTGTYPNFTDATVASGNCYQYQYLISDNAGNQATYTGSNTAKVDTAAPSGGSMSYTNGYITATSVFLTAADGTDAASGINTGSRTVQRRSATLSNGSCGSYGTWSTISQSGTYPNFTDSTVVTGNCYQYRYQVSDNAVPANQATYASSNTIMIDTAAPSGGSLFYTDGYNSTHSVTIAASDGTDSASGINTGSRTVQRRSATISSGSCGSYGTWSTISQSGTYPNFTDSTVVTGNCYQYRYQVADNAGQQTVYTATSSVKVTFASDINLDGKTDYLDYGMFHNNYGNTTCGNVADITGPDPVTHLCTVDYLDYGILHSEYGSSLL